jgi:hypothetical protein
MKTRLNAAVTIRDAKGRQASTRVHVGDFDSLQAARSHTQGLGASALASSAFPQSIWIGAEVAWEIAELVSIPAAAAA